MTTGVPVWGPVDFAYEIAVASSLTVPYLDLTCDGQMDVIDDGATSSAVAHSVATPIQRHAGRVHLQFHRAAAHRLLRLVTGRLRASNTFGNILPSTTEKLRVRATNLKTQTL